MGVWSRCAGVRTETSVRADKGPGRALRAPLVEPRFRLAFFLVASLFFSWAMAAALNDVLIRQFQKSLGLGRTGASLVQLAFYIGYFCAAVPAGVLIRRAGYKATMIVGLLLYAAGAFLFYPAAELQRYGLFLAALYVIAIGLAFLETAANPYVTVLGRPETASARLNLAQAFYGLGAILGPVVGGLFILSGVELNPVAREAMTAEALAAYHAREAASVELPYLVIGVCVCLLALAIRMSPFPSLDHEAPSARLRSMFAVLRHRGLRRAVIAQFFYVGAQVGVWSFFIDFAKDQTPWLSERSVALLLSTSLGMLLLGRLTGAFIQRVVAPARLLTIYAAVNVFLCLAAALTSGTFAVAGLWLTSFFMSILFPTIFALGVDGLGAERDAGSSFLIMAIIGGAVIPPSMGVVSDALGGVHHMMLVPAACFAAVTLFGLLARRHGASA